MKRTIDSGEQAISGNLFCLPGSQIVSLLVLSNLDRSNLGVLNMTQCQFFLFQLQERLPWKCSSYCLSICMYSAEYRM